MAQRIREEATDDWDDKVAVERFTGKGGTFVRGYGTARRPRSGVASATQVYEGSRGHRAGAPAPRPSIPPIDGLAGTPYWTNREAIEVRRRCRSR